MTAGAVLALIKALGGGGGGGSSGGGLFIITETESESGTVLNKNYTEIGEALESGLIPVIKRVGVNEMWPNATTYDYFYAIGNYESMYFVVFSEGAQAYTATSATGELALMEG